MEVSAKHEGQTLTFFLVGELDHHGAKGLLENLEREIERTLPPVYYKHLPLPTNSIR